MSKSIVVQDKYSGYCLICGKPTTTMHHCIEGTGNRRISDREKLIVPLCDYHHNMSNMSVHHNEEMRTLMHIIGQYAWMFNFLAEQNQVPFYDFREDAIENFRKVFGKSYI